MSGIAGLVSLKALPPEATLREMAHRMSDRGPGGEGIQIYPGQPLACALVHRPLSADRPAEGQPMSDPTGTAWCVLDGAIYNNVELRSELKAQGQSFKTGVDAEVLLAAWRVWGTAMLSHLNGGFAFAIWDTAKRRIFAARDRFGEKPFFWRAHETAFAFSSELKALKPLEGPTFPRTRIDEGWLYGFLQFAPLENDESTMLDGVRRLPPGHRLLASAEGGRVSVKVERWYDLPVPEPVEGDPDSAARHRALFDDSVRLCRRAELPSGLSSAFAGAAASPGELERDFARLVEIQEEPFPSAGVYEQYRIFQEARAAGITVLLDGQGADESLADYPKREVRDYVMRQLVPGPLRRMIESARMPRGAPSAALVSADARRRNGIPEKLRADLRGGGGAGAVLRHALGAGPLQMLLRYADRNASAHGCEARFPFLDHRLVELSLGLEDSWKRRNGMTGTVLRETLARSTPEPNRLATDAWITGPLRGWFSERAENAITRLEGLVDAEAARETIAQLTPEHPDRARAIARLFPWVSAGASVAAFEAGRI